MNETPRDEAVQLLQHYLRNLAKHAGMKWNSDNDVEAAQIVDSILEAVDTRVAEAMTTVKRRGGRRP